jgi:hypothetical protein
MCCCYDDGCPPPSALFFTFDTPLNHATVTADRPLQAVRFFAPTITECVGSNHNRGMNVCELSFCLCYLVCSYSLCVGLFTRPRILTDFVQNQKTEKKNSQGQKMSCRAIDNDDDYDNDKFQYIYLPHFLTG